MKQNKLTDILDIEHPIIMAPMFLVSDVNMTKIALDSGITGCIPAMNYRSLKELETAIRELKKHSDKPFGINLIVNKSNFNYKKQLEICCNEKVAYIITSLGSPKETIKMAHAVGTKVFCDVVDLKFAKKVEKLGADAIIAVNKEAGGHSGPKSYTELIPELHKNCSIPIISAGGTATGEQIKAMLSIGAAGVSMGSIFIASKEAPVSDEYKQACVDYGAKDIILTTKVSGTPCTVINTPYVQQTGTEQNWFEKLLNKNKKIKKWVKAFVFAKGMKTLQKSAFSSTYKTVWCAGPSIEYVTEIKPLKEIINQLTSNYEG